MGFRDALLDLLARRVNGIGSKRALAKRLYELHPGTARDESSWKSQVQAWTAPGGAAQEPREQSIRLVAEAFAIPRETLPQARPAWWNRVQQLEQEVAELRRMLEER